MHWHTGSSLVPRRGPGIKLKKGDKDLRGFTAPLLVRWLHRELTRTTARRAEWRVGTPEAGETC